MDLTFQVPIQYGSLQHQTLYSPQHTPTTGHHFYFGLASSFFLEPFLCPSPVAYWTATDLEGGGSSSSFTSFCHFVLFLGFSRQEYRIKSPPLSPVDHHLSELFTMTCLSWVALHAMAQTSFELGKAVAHVIILVSFPWLWFTFWRPWGCSSCFFFLY